MDKVKNKIANKVIDKKTTDNREEKYGENKINAIASGYNVNSAVNNINAAKRKRDKAAYPYIDVIKDIMIKNSYSQQAFALIIGVNQTTVSQWLLGRKKPTYESILMICKKFDVTPNEFFGY